MAQNFKMARKIKYTKLPLPPYKIAEGDSILIKDHTNGPFDPVYVSDYQVVALHGNQVEIRSTYGGKMKKVHISNVKYVLPADNITSKIPDYKLFGRKTKLRTNLDHVPNLGWQLATMVNTKLVDTQMPVQNVTTTTNKGSDANTTSIHTTPKVLTGPYNLRYHK